MNKHRPIAPNDLRNALAEVGVYSEKLESDEKLKSDEPQEEGAA